MNQKTIAQKLSFDGLGIHSGEGASVSIYPAPAGFGIVLLSTQVPNEPIKIGSIIPEQSMHATVLKSKNWGISTVEHLFAAIQGLGIDNLIVEVENQELPILDGSALPFVQGITSVGLIEQNANKIFITPKETLVFEEPGRFIKIEPAKDNLDLNFEYSVDFEHPLLQPSTFSGKLSQDFFVNQVAPARTFGFLEQLPLLRKHGLAKGTTLGNTVVIGEDVFLNMRRFDDELVRHKLLDLLGDLAILGKNLVGTVKAHKTGHSFNRKVVEHFLKNPDLWQLINCDS